MAKLIQDSNYDNYKLVILGYYSVGKSSIVLKYAKGVFNIDEESTIGAAFITKTFLYEDRYVKYEIWDTAGQERYSSLVPMYYRGAHAALIVYDITKPFSFESAKKWVEELLIEKPNNFLKILIGNKTDLESERQISTEEGEAYAKEKGLLFYECSAMDNSNIDKVFSDICSVLSKQKSEIKAPSINIRKSKRGFNCC